MTDLEMLVNRGVDTIYPSKPELEKVLKSGKKLKLYQGFDPTGTQLHIGHMIGFRKLRQWQDLGHHVIFLIGDGTGQAGDPSGKLKGREKFFDRDELRRNAKEYVMQASKIMRFDGDNPVEILYNGDWLNDLKLVDVLNIAGHFTLQQLSERDMFSERLKKGEPVNMREFLYPLLQGYDSVAMNVDLELGGSDQMFNMMCGRDLVKGYLSKEKFVMTVPLLTDSQGKKIGKSEGNVVGLTDAPEELFGKIMSLGDDIILKSFELLTDTPMEEITQIAKDLEKGANPIDYKKKLAFEIVKQLNSHEQANYAQKHFESTVQNDELPADIPEWTIDPGLYEITDLLLDTGLVTSKSEARRLVTQGGVTIMHEKEEKRIDDIHTLVEVKSGLIIKVGKRRYLQLKLENK
ncbi:MAG: tyrosine--tRNA ligase [bacterium]|nr:tyrosine--tRNA ligase [bacterium]